MTRKHPYSGLPDRQFWKRAPGVADLNAFDPVSDVPFRISPDDRIVTAGSCFAQHVARYLSQSGFDHHIAEPAHPIVPADVAEAHNYGLFSARYGNLYTARQLLQLIRRAYGDFTPQADAWDGPKPGTFVDPFRPQIQPGGYASVEELAADRAQHLAAVRRAFETMDVFVFTLGLTEGWEDTRDGAVFPLAPGVAGGTYDPALTAFRNFDEVETADDLTEALTLIRQRNPDVRIILTVSPVPLNATFIDRHVAVSTTWSKAALRIAAEKVRNRFDACCYFPSFEVITSPQARGRYFAEDGREVLPAGVAHVMRLFFHHLAGVTVDTTAAPRAKAPIRDAHSQEMARAMQVLCDEEAINND
ncbi:GSCFA domain-containing protein [Puniceibacterium sp. IMCC21224]|uniref:GSCFA domain-containing protein n=1 Tax=Puniceibacterium sp. IMCC21224 TaxID=1618204 RepID=UPI00064DFCEE|nr:GSCFA domain-containing protein [Puniceibacterium sp. IMCC21224]KMK66275.1 GSCFA family protein [Puniceibacterium sp. IMCC21224]